MSVPVLVLVNGLAAGFVLAAALAKFVAPGQLSLALKELAPTAAGVVTTRHVRAIAVLELAAGLLLLVPSLRVGAATVVAALGACFAAAGVLGALRGVTTACGCAGQARGRPLGALNIAIGGGLGAVIIPNLLLELNASDATDYTRFLLPAATVAALGLTVWLNRRLAFALLRPVKRDQAEPVVR